MNKPLPIRVALVGAGYIATWHADALRATLGVQLVAVCDVSPAAAQSFAEAYGIQAFTSLDDLIAAQVCDSVHILTPPNLHHDLALTCLKAGLHCFVEKPMSVSAQQAHEMRAAAAQANRQIGVSHNFLGLPAYSRLKQSVHSGDLGRIASAEVNWHLPLAPLRSGPFGLWLLREPQNLLLELGPHLYAFVVDLFGAPEILHVEWSHPVTLAGGAVRPQSIRVLARAGHVNVTFNFGLVETVDDRSVTLRGSSASARLDYANDTLIITRDNTADLVLNPFVKQMSLAVQHAREGAVNAAKQLVSLNQKSPYGLSFRGAFSAFYQSIQNGTAPDPRFTGTALTQIMTALEQTSARMHFAPDPKPVKGKPKPTVMVIGGTGFIGRNLTRTLVSRGFDVRVLSRGKTGPFDDIANHVETVPVSLRDAVGLQQAMQGIDAVFNLAKSMDSTWDDALENDVGVSVRIANAAMAAGVKKLIYTGTIASYDMSDKGTTITELTAFDTDMSDRNLYARSKAECERQLLALHRENGLPVCIARPGIVVGHGGPLQHWGIGRWHGAGALKIWGNGRNILPFVLVDDVSDGLIRMMQNEDAIGKSFNLVGEPMMSARDYFNEIHKTLGAKLRLSTGSLFAMFLADAMKYTLKRHVLRRHGVIRPSLRDWKSRAHYARFDNALPKQVLGWAPEKDRSRFVAAAIRDADLFGF